MVHIDDDKRCTICGDFDGDTHNLMLKTPLHKFTTEGERQMYVVVYTQMLERSTEVWVTAEQYRTLHQVEDAVARSVAEQYVTDTALSQMDSEHLEFVMACITDEDDEEVFDIG